jgi:Peptidase C26
MVLFRCSSCLAFVLFVLPGGRPSSCCYAATSLNDDDETKGTVRAVPPVVGILSEPMRTDQNTTEFVIAASYVKWLEVSGARSIPIPYDATRTQVEDMFHHHAIDGVLFPGGAGKRLPPAARHIWKLAQQVNAKQDGQDNEVLTRTLKYRITVSLFYGVARLFWWADEREGTDRDIDLCMTTL